MPDARTCRQVHTDPFAYLDLSQTLLSIQQRPLLLLNLLPTPPSPYNINEPNSPTPPKAPPLLFPPSPYPSRPPPEKDRTDNQSHSRECRQYTHHTRQEGDSRDMASKGTGAKLPSLRPEGADVRIGEWREQLWV
ncbi:hypothetical protein VTL71DRAFT_4143 [Oculimacula yallundae]|uniref:Uncharacterized protein n=1 Tax=Oculimacula yallundae TaxID=86028 RepID=A0ABR4C7B7_9HELO